MGWGPVGAATVLRPWAERLVDALGPRPGERILDASADGGLLHRRLARAVGPHGAVVAAGPAGHPAAAGTPFSAAASLFSIPLVSDAGAHLAGLLRAVDPRAGRVAVLIQLGGRGSPHETAVAGVLGGVARPATLSAVEIDALCGDGPLRPERLRDVVRFDGLGQLWTALVTERGIGADLDARRRGALEASLGRWIAADGTLRIAAEAVCLRHRAWPAGRVTSGV
ncbi:MAG: ubiE/COQ5 methyltransferase family [Chloroflexota bacterium]|nr:ubiE/COQ5 methyltransferase family [Chloroflexota bacterium]